MKTWMSCCLHGALILLLTAGAAWAQATAFEWTFNLFNVFNWGNPVTNFNSGTFGRITTQAGVPRILQLGVKYAF